MSDIDEFSRMIDQAATDKIFTPAKTLFNSVCIQLFDVITANSQEISGGGSPVLTGRYYNSHRVSLNEIDTSVAEPNPEGAKDPYPPLPEDIVLSALQQWKPGDTLYIANSVPYADAIENLDASPQKTPDGVYGVSVEVVRNRLAGGFGNLTVKTSGVL